MKYHRCRIRQLNQFFLSNKEIASMSDQGPGEAIRDSFVKSLILLCFEIIDCHHSPGSVKDFTTMNMIIRAITIPNLPSESIFQTFHRDMMNAVKPQVIPRLNINCNKNLIVFIICILKETVNQIQKLPIQLVPTGAVPNERVPR